MLENKYDTKAQLIREIIDKLDFIKILNYVFFLNFCSLKDILRNQKKKENDTNRE